LTVSLAILFLLTWWLLPDWISPVDQRSKILLGMSNYGAIFDRRVVMSLS
jgi:hypothetical protein